MPGTAANLSETGQKTLRDFHDYEVDKFLLSIIREELLTAGDFFYVE